MKCSIIRDLLPLYEVHKCSKETRKVVFNHLETCKSCRGLYEVMQEEVGLKTSMIVEEKLERDQVFWCKYYGALLIKGLVIFLLVYATLIGIKLIF